ncbi:MAG: GNAT family N-acetyltransferase [Candidatus Eisenbacteria bacterium]
MTLYTPLCKVRPVLRGCSFLVSTDGRRLSAIVAYGEDSIELTWGLPGRAETLRNLIVQVRNRVRSLTFLPVLETGRRSWSEMLALQVLGRYFRARYVEAVPGHIQAPPGLRIATIDPSTDLPAVVELMNAAYPSLPHFMSLERLRAMIAADYHYADGWFFLRDEEQNRPIGLAISGHCSQTDEGFIDWIQVLPRYRQQGLGAMLVQESVRRLAAAGCITVSGTLDAPFAMGDLYKKCGFGQFRQWTILGQPARAGADPHGDGS